MREKSKNDLRKLELNSNLLTQFSNFFRILSFDGHDFLILFIKNIIQTYEIFLLR